MSALYFLKKKKKVVNEFLDGKKKTLKCSNYYYSFFPSSFLTDPFKMVSVKADLSPNTEVNGGCVSSF